MTTSHQSFLPVTVSSTALSFAFWAAHMGDIAIVVSATASVLGVALQFWMAFGRLQKLERLQNQQSLDTTISDARLTKLEGEKHDD